MVIDRIDFQDDLKCSNKVHVLIPNLDQLEYTQNLVGSLLVQEADFDLTIFDQNNTDEYTNRYYEDLVRLWPREKCELNIIRNSVNAPLNHVWNWFYKHTSNPYLALLNNDIEICNNFIGDAEKIFDLVPECGVISHPTNVKEYTKKEDLQYEIIESNPYLQGWDMIIRRDAYNEIPKELWIYAGDTYLYSEMFKSGYRQVYDISSPMIHYRQATIKSNLSDISDILSWDLEIYNAQHEDLTIFDDHKYCHRDFAGVFPIDLTKKIIVSFTTWKKRISNIPHIVDLMLKQTRVPDRIILNISEEEFKDDRDCLDEIFNIKDPRFEINWVAGENTKVWKKFIPIIDKYPNDLVLTIDDDLEYPEDYIETYWNSYCHNPYSPLTGMDNIWYGIHHCCGAFNMFQYKFMALYLPLWKEAYKDIRSSDTFYIYIHKLNGIEFKTTDKIFYGKIENYNNNDSYSISNASDDPDWTVKGYLYLINKFGKIKDFNPNASGDSAKIPFNIDYLMHPDDPKRKDAGIFILCYKDTVYPIPNNKLYTPLQCGAEIFPDIEGMVKDNTGDNISEKNSFYAETTGTYWIWKNMAAKYKYVGQCQYRRWLVLDENIDFNKLFKKYDAVAARPMPLKTFVANQFGNCHNINDLFLVQHIIDKKFPEYSEDFIKYILNDNLLYYSSGVVMKSADFNRYCDFLFTIIGEHERMNNIADPESMKRYLSKPFKRTNIERQRFLYGFLAERLMTLFIRHNFKNVLHLSYWLPEVLNSGEPHYNRVYKFLSK